MVKAGVYEILLITKEQPISIIRRRHLVARLKSNGLPVNAERFQRGENRLTRFFEERLRNLASLDKYLVHTACLNPTTDKMRHWMMNFTMPEDREVTGAVLA